MHKLDLVGVATIASGTSLLVRGKTMAEDSLGMVLLQHGSFFDDRMSITRSTDFISQISVQRFIGPKLIKAALD